MHQFHYFPWRVKSVTHITHIKNQFVGNLLLIATLHTEADKLLKFI